jgi:hypothetical protein
MRLRISCDPSLPITLLPRGNAAESRQAGALDECSSLNFGFSEPEVELGDAAGEGVPRCTAYVHAVRETGDRASHTHADLLGERPSVWVIRKIGREGRGGSGDRHAADVSIPRVACGNATAVVLPQITVDPPRLGAGAFSGGRVRRSGCSPWCRRALTCGLWFCRARWCRSGGHLLAIVPATTSRDQDQRHSKCSEERPQLARTNSPAAAFSPIARSVSSIAIVISAASGCTSRTSSSRPGSSPCS